MKQAEPQQYFSNLLKNISEIAKQDNEVKKIPKRDLHWMVQDLKDADVLWPAEEVENKPLTVVYINHRPVIVEGIATYIKSLSDTRKTTVDAYIIDQKFYFNYLNQVH